MKLNTILQGDALEVSKTIPSNLVDLVMTSPPYYGLRDYDEPGQWGLEESLYQWVDKMLLLTAELKRIIKYSGSFILNVGDTYSGSGKGYHPGHEDESKEVYHFKTKPHLVNHIPRKSLMLLPERLVTRMIDEQGWILINKIPWIKKNPMPISAKRRLKNKWEYLFWFVKNNKVLQWSNIITGEGVLQKPKQKYVDFDSITIIDKRYWRCHTCGAVGNTIQHIQDHKKEWTKPLWRGMDYYYDLMAVAVPAKTKEMRPYGIIRTREYEYDSKYLGIESASGLQNFKKQDNVPSKNAGMYEGFNARWKEQAKKRNQPVEFTERQKQYKEQFYGEDPNNLARKKAWLHTDGKEGWEKMRGLVKGDVNVGTEQFHSANIDYTILVNPGDVVEFATEPLKFKHYTSFPTKLVEWVFKLGAPRWICKECDFIRERQTKTEYLSKISDKPSRASEAGQNRFTQRFGDGMKVGTIGWSSCNCALEDRYNSGLVFDPFMGSGTVGLVAQRMNLNWLGVELKQSYIDIAYQRLYKGHLPLDAFITP